MTGHQVLMTIATEFRPLLLEGEPQIASWVQSGLTVRVVRGRKMRTLATLFDEFAAALQFPLYFGENRDAFDECIANLEDMPPGKGYVVAVTDPERVLADEAPEALTWLVASLTGATEAYGQPIDRGEWWDRPAVPFHVVLAGADEAIPSTVRRWSAASTLLMPLVSMGEL